MGVDVETISPGDGTVQGQGQGQDVGSEGLRALGAGGGIRWREESRSGQGLQGEQVGGRIPGVAVAGSVGASGRLPLAWPEGRAV